LFPITVEKFDLETALVINQYVYGRNWHVNAAIKFAGFLYFRLAVSSMNLPNSAFECFWINLGRIYSGFLVLGYTLEQMNY
jgi:hypothetical protein